MSDGNERHRALRNASAPVALDHLRQVAHGRGSNRCPRSRSTRGAIAAQADLAAALLSAGLREMGVQTGASFNADSLGIVSAMRPVFAQLMEKLVERALFVDGNPAGRTPFSRNGHASSESNATWRPTPAFTTAADSASDAPRAFITQHPGHLPEASLCAATCAELGPILRGKKDAVQILFAGAGAEVLDQFYGDGLLTCHWLTAIASAVQESASSSRRTRPAHFGSRRGNGRLASHLLPLLERGLHTPFSDVSAGFFSAARPKLAAFQKSNTRFSTSKVRH
jgi:hypothetical protein